MKYAIAILLFSLLGTSIAATEPEEMTPIPKAFLQCVGERSSARTANGKTEATEQGEISSELKVDDKSIFLMVDGKYYDMALPILSFFIVELEYKVTKHIYSVGSRFVKLDTTYFLAPTEALPSRRETRVEYLIDRHNGSYKYTNTYFHRGRSTWFTQSVESGVCKPFNPDRQVF